MSRSGTVRTVATTAGVTALLVVVALSAGSVLGRGGRGRLFHLDREVMAGVMQQTLFVVYVAILANALYLWLTRDDRARRPGAARDRSSPVGFLLALLVVVAFLIVRLYLWDRIFPNLEAEPIPTSLATVPSAVGSVGSGPGAVPTAETTQWGLAVVGLAALALVVLLAIAWRRTEARGPVLTAVPVPEETTASPPVQVPPPGDARDRVFAAYRAVEEDAHRRGMERGRSETVTSYLRRLPGAGPEAGRRLTSIYNRARFSRHDVTPDDAGEAEGAGQDIRRAML
jgi:hypothetical protein